MHAFSFDVTDLCATDYFAEVIKFSEVPET